MSARLPEDLYTEIDDRLAAADARVEARYPGDSPGRQPVHTVYVPAGSYDGAIVTEWGDRAAAVFAEHGSRLGIDAEVAARVRAKLATEPIEDLRIDFEDGYGAPGDAAEDAEAERAARTLGHSLSVGTAPPFCGIRFKSLERATRRRGIRTLDVFLAALLDTGPLPLGFTVTLPKVTAPEQAGAAAAVLERLESVHGLAREVLRFEVQIETAQSITGPDGTVAVSRILAEAGPRCDGLHYGTYDYSAGLGIAAEYQSMDHPAADFAKSFMQVAAAGTGVRLSDGSTNRLPLGDRDAVVAAWREHLRLVRRSLERGFYQGWDLHPHQLPTRFAATYAFFREGLPAAAQRLRAYADRSAGGVLDEPATAQALATFLLRGVDCGALDGRDLPFGRDVLHAFATRVLP
ncbi:aldolase [Amycolatopsis antarctica]|uniref:Aldolase n=1 Tax=Amycolatopsis antarctica TaxID=1854586 RepID=A0A263D6V2_9PSEU|nr:aldolase/citrate lyase family protein [Amycolatopsis antarctica]OZM74101.1 aldolase [Amycolatopsis antarctica]